MAVLVDPTGFGVHGGPGAACWLELLTRDAAAPSTPPRPVSPSGGAVLEQP